MMTCTTDMLGVTADTKFILLDLRDLDEYKAYHIKEAINFPAPNITRDKTFAQLLRFKNMPDKIIVVYMSDERQGTHYAKLLHEKGFDNVYLLTGGIEKFLETNPSQVEGTNVPTAEDIKKRMQKTAQGSKFLKK
jgi:centrosomal protein CEP41